MFKKSFYRVHREPVRLDSCAGGRLRKKKKKKRLNRNRNIPHQVFLISRVAGKQNAREWMRREAKRNTLIWAISKRNRTQHVDETTARGVLASRSQRRANTPARCDAPWQPLGSSRFSNPMYRRPLVLCIETPCIFQLLRVTISIKYNICVL